MRSRTLWAVTFSMQTAFSNVVLELKPLGLGGQSEQRIKAALESQICHEMGWTSGVITGDFSKNGAHPGGHERDIGDELFARISI